jgi:hypothetical protein
MRFPNGGIASRLDVESQLERINIIENRLTRNHAVPVNVEPMGPDLMFEKVTELLPWVASTVLGSPEVVEQGPRRTPGLVTEPLVGYTLSSLYMPAVWSSL